MVMKSKEAWARISTAVLMNNYQPILQLSILIENKQAPG